MKIRRGEKGRKRKCKTTVYFEVGFAVTQLRNYAIT